MEAMASEMSYQLKDVIHETDSHFVLRVKNGYEVYKNGVTHSIRCAQIGFKDDEGLNRAISECDRRS